MKYGCNTEIARGIGGIEIYTLGQKSSHPTPKAILKSREDQNAQFSIVEWWRLVGEVDRGTKIVEG